MPNALIVEIVAVAILATLALSNFIIGRKRPDLSAWPVSTMAIACLIVIVVLVFVNLQSQMSFWENYYWRYCYMGCWPVIMPICFATSYCAEVDILILSVFLLLLLLFLLLGWILVILILIGCIAYLLQEGQTRSSQSLEGNPT